MLTHHPAKKGVRKQCVSPYATPYARLRGLRKPYAAYATSKLTHGRVT